MKRFVFLLLAFFALLVGSPNPLSAEPSTSRHRHRTEVVVCESHYFVADYSVQTEILVTDSDVSYQTPSFIPNKANDFYLAIKSLSLQYDGTNYLLSDNNFQSKFQSRLTVLKPIHKAYFGTNYFSNGYDVAI